DVAGYLERSFRPVAQQKGLEFHVDHDADTPPGFWTDGQRLQQILRNLLGNAFKFTETGKVSVRVSVAASSMSFNSVALRESPRSVRFRVSDTGIGIPKDKHQLIFEAFQQADGTTSRKYGGTGLGLSISRELARLLGGEIRVESKVGGGSTFTLYLPETFAATGEEADSHPDVTAHAAKATAIRPLRKPVTEVLSIADDAMAKNELADDRGAITPDDRVILIVEDDPQFAKVLLDMAREKSFKAVVALRGDSGL